MNKCNMQLRHMTRKVMTEQKNNAKVIVM
uniref:Transposase n=1 Tax=Heterorhabditis bacteriophora TaxID=37862 RepID=A0A1I7WNE5_HETBA